MSQFNAQEWEGLSPAEQKQRCRTMAEQAITLADSAPPDLKEGYLSMAAVWLRLADDIGRSALLHETDRA